MREFMITMKLKDFESDDEYYWGYASVDKKITDYDDSNCPPYISRYRESGKVFQSVKEAKKWWDKSKKRLFDEYKYIDISTIAIRKITYSTCLKLEKGE